MKLHYAALLLFIMPLFSSYAQNDTTKITVQNQELYLTTVIGFPILGTYLYDGEAEPIVQLNANGTGVFQLRNLTKNNISWGIESNDKGYPKYKEGFNSAAYTLWYKNNDDSNDNWNATQFSIHYDKKKIFIAGERSKEYQDEMK